MSQLIMFDPQQYDTLEDAMIHGATYQCRMHKIDMKDQIEVNNVLRIVEATADMLSHKHRVEVFILQGNQIINIREVIYGIT